MPIATINAVVQMLVPPPKYDVQRLVPHARLTQTSHLAGMFIIERGGEGVQLIAEHDALTTLLANGDDAYGFPPYDAIKEFLYTSGSEDLREREREIVAGALRGVPTRFVRSSQLDWSDRIPTMTNATIEATKGAVGVE